MFDLSGSAQFFSGSSQEFPRCVSLLRKNVQSVDREAQIAEVSVIRAATLDRTILLVMLHAYLYSAFNVHCDTSISFPSLVFYAHMYPTSIVLLPAGLSIHHFDNTSSPSIHRQWEFQPSRQGKIQRNCPTATSSLSDRT